ncbi:MAG: MarR family winged helix-turn-helix transcriptional regulator [Thermoleophilia bacterium]
MPDASSPISPGAPKLWLSLWRASRAVEAHARRNINELGLGLTDFAVLEALLHKGSLPVGSIGKTVMLTSGSMTAAVDRLEKVNLVERSADPRDRRARIVRLTTAGRTLITETLVDHERALERATTGLSPEERRTLVRLLLKLTRGAQPRACPPLTAC